MDAVMDPIYPVSALQKRQGDVKRAAQDHIVRITENGTGAYVFCSEAMFEQRMAEVAEQAAYEERLAMGIERGRADYAAERVVRGVDAARAELKRRYFHG
ncbi:hypothetical protein [uncultured Adlercreutzia sp.]|uniref:hypothetical protein n=1 Tax=uncultured Adlercreutzia sp. TaxID=875803 RepID=UPI00258C10AE|nr:hypothetical protein [uncultured Adlercreutzia sp.]